MFIEYPLEPTKPELSLCSPDRTIISHIPEMFEWEHEGKLSNISLLSFNLPFKVEVRGKLVHNKNIDLIKERFLIKFKLKNFVEYFLIQKITTVHNESSDYKQIECAGLAIQLTDKKITNYSATSKNATQLLTDILKGTSWGLGSIAGEFDTKYRSFEFTGNLADAVTQIAETFQAIVVYDSINKTVNFYKSNQYGQNKGWEVSKEKLLKSIVYESNTSEQVTRLEVRGKDGVSIHSVTSTGSSFLENVDYFKNNGFMSPGLSTAWTNYTNLKQSKEAEFNGYLTNLNTLNLTLTTKRGELATLQAELNVINDTLDVKNSQNQDATSTIAAKIVKEQEVATKNSEIGTIQNQIGIINNNIATLANILSMNNNFTTQQLIELDNFIIVGEYVNENISEPVTLKQEAMTFFESLLAPKLIVEIDIVNLFEIMEFQESADLDKVMLGDIINIKYDLSNINITARIIEIRTSESGNISLVISNIEKAKTDEEKWLDDLRTSVGSAKAFAINKYAYDNAAVKTDEVSQILENTWSTLDRKLAGGYQNQVTFDGRGLIIRDPSDPNRMIIQQAGVIGLSKDGGNHFSTAMSADGLIAERLLGNIVITNNLLLSNQNNSFTVNENGATATNMIINVTRSDNKSRILLDPTNGIKIQSSTNGTTWVDKISADANGQIIAEDLVTNRLILKNGNDVLVDANNRTIDFSKFTTKIGSISASNIDATNLQVSSANIIGLITAGQLNVRGGFGGMTTLLNGYNDSNGGKLAIHDNDGFTNVRIGVEASGGDNTGGTLVLYNDAPSNVVGFSNKQRAEIAIRSASDAGYINLRDTNAIARISIEAYHPTLSTPYIGIRNSSEQLQTWFTSTIGYINNSEVLTKANINTVTITAKFK